MSALADGQVQRLLSALDAEPAEAFPVSLGELVGCLTRTPARLLNTSSDEIAQGHIEGARHVPFIACLRRRTRSEPSSCVNETELHSLQCIVALLRQPRHDSHCALRAVLLRVLTVLINRRDVATTAAVLNEGASLWAYHALRRWSGEAPTREPAVLLLQVRRIPQSRPERRPARQLSLIYHHPFGKHKASVSCKNKICDASCISLPRSQAILSCGDDAAARSIVGLSCDPGGLLGMPRVAGLERRGAQFVSAARRADWETAEAGAACDESPVQIQDDQKSPPPGAAESCRPLCVNPKALINTVPLPRR